MNNNIKYWTFPCNIDDYNVIDALKDLKIIEWEQKLSNVKVNDICYIYVGSPYSKIMFKCRINKVNLKTVSIDDSKYWTDLSKKAKYDKYMEIELLHQYDDNDYFKYENLKNNGFRNHQSQASATEELINYLESYDVVDYSAMNKYYDEVNKKIVEDKKLWLKVLDKEEQNDNGALDILFYLYDCKNFTSNVQAIAKYFKTEVSTINSYILEFGKRVIDLLNLDEQLDDNSQSKYWNIFFETVRELNKNDVFTWKLRKELVEALVEKYDLIIKEQFSIDDMIKKYMNEFPYDTFLLSIKDELEVREYFVNKFDINSLMQMELNDYVLGRADIADDGKDSFCYLIERTMIHIGDMRGANISKFGVWYDKEEKQYKHTKKYGDTLEKAFETLKKEICLLLVNANNDDYEKINDCEIANLFKGKILSTYFPDKFLCIFEEDDINKFLNVLNINYDIRKYNTLEKKKILLKEFKNNNKYFKDKNDYYFMMFLYTTFKKELDIKNTVSGEIDYDIEFVDFEYLSKHISEKKRGYRSRGTDYERINRNKKDVGNRGERAILQNEINKLNNLGLTSLAKRVNICDNDAIGYDIISYNENGEEIHIEVKTNSGNKSYLDFYITDNELEHLKSEDNYYIYYLFNIKGKPKCHIINKDSILEKEKEFFQPVIYKVNIDVEKIND